MIQALLLLLGPACSKASDPEIVYRVARDEIVIGSAAWDIYPLPTGSLSILNLSEQTLLITPLSLDGEGGELLGWSEFPDYTEVRPSDSISILVSPVEDRTLWTSGSFSPVLTVEVGAAWNDPSDFAQAPEWFEDRLEVPVLFSLDCDLDDDGEESAACGGSDCEAGRLDIDPGPGCSDTGGA